MAMEPRATREFHRRGLVRSVRDGLVLVVYLSAMKKRASTGGHARTEISTWLLLLYALPARRTSARVNLWRKLKKFGAVQLKTSTYILPDHPAQFERFQW